MKFLNHLTTPKAKEQATTDKIVYKWTHGECPKPPKVMFSEALYKLIIENKASDNMDEIFEIIKKNNFKMKVLEKSPQGKYTNALIETLNDLKVRCGLKDSKFKTLKTKEDIYNKILQLLNLYYDLSKNKDKKKVEFDDYMIAFYRWLFNGNEEEKPVVKRNVVDEECGNCCVWKDFCSKNIFLLDKVIKADNKRLEDEFDKLKPFLNSFSDDNTNEDTNEDTNEENKKNRSLKKN